MCVRLAGARSGVGGIGIYRTLPSAVLPKTPTRYPQTIISLTRGMASGVTSPALLVSPYVLPRYCLLPEEGANRGVSEVVFFWMAQEASSGCHNEITRRKKTSVPQRVQHRQETVIFLKLRQCTGGSLGSCRGARRDFF
jgi:hypothetical protein